MSYATNRIELYLELPVADVTCRQGTLRHLASDLYLPPEPSGLVVYIHGGGWQEGSKDRPAGYRTLLLAGYAIASVEYRFSTQGSWRDMLMDVAAGIAATRATYHRLRPGAPGFLAVWGISAGGHLASLVSLHPDTNVRPSVVCSWCGPMDLVSYAARLGVRDHCRDDVTSMLNLLTDNDAEALAEASPLRYVTSTAIPHLFVHGDDDGLVPLSQSRTMHEALLSADAESEFYVAVGHSHALPPHEWEGLHRMIGFLDTHRTGTENHPA